MFYRRIYFKFIVFIALFTAVFFLVRGVYFTYYVPEGDLPWLFSAITLMFSIISGFIIQSKWQTWNALTDATHGEISSIRQINLLSNHFPISIKNKILTDIYNYLGFVIEENKTLNTKFKRSADVERSIYKLEETVLDIDYREHPNIGSLAYDMIRNILDYREKKLQNISHKLPKGVKFFTLNALLAVIFSSLFIGSRYSLSEYLLGLITALLAFGIYILIDDLDNPFRPGQWNINSETYVRLRDSIEKNLKNSK